MKDRNIMQNIRRTIELVDVCHRKKLESLIMSIDFEKCFDSIKFTALEGALKFFNYGERFIRWTKLLFTDFTVVVHDNGKITDWIDKTCGCHQGCCYSPFRFLLCGEIFSLVLEKSADNCKIPINTLTSLLSPICR